MKQIQYTESGDWNLQTDYDRLTDQTATFFVCPTFHSDTQCVTFEITGPPNAQCKIESSSDLAQWTVRQTITLSGTGTGTFNDNSVAGVSYRFYRATP